MELEPKTCYKKKVRPGLTPRSFMRAGKERGLSTRKEIQNEAQDADVDYVGPEKWSLQSTELHIISPQ